MSKGIVSSVTLNNMHLSLHADEGWSGGVVVNLHGRLVGMIIKGDGVHMLRATAVYSLQGFMQEHGKPCFRD
jgi:hypothetical protein